MHSNVHHAGTDWTNPLFCLGELRKSGPAQRAPKAGALRASLRTVRTTIAPVSGGHRAAFYLGKRSGAVRPLNHSVSDRRASRLHLVPCYEVGSPVTRRPSGRQDGPGAATSHSATVLVREGAVGVVARGVISNNGPGDSNYRPHACQAPQRGSESRQDAGKPRWIARFAAFVIPRCRDLPSSIDRTTDRTRDSCGPRSGGVRSLVLWVRSHAHHRPRSPLHTGGTARAPPPCSAPVR